MKKILFLFFPLACALQASAQLGNLNVQCALGELVEYEVDTLSCYRLNVRGVSDTIQDTFCESYYSRTFEGLPIGKYLVQLCSYPDTTQFRQSVQATITENNVTFVRLNDASVYTDAITPPTPCDDPPEEQVFDISLYDHHWYKQDGIRSGQQFSYAFSAPSAITPHLLFVYRSGMEFSHYRLEGDSAEVKNQMIAVQSKNYNYLNFKMDLALRVQSKKVSVYQLDRAIKLEGGITYRLPLLFKSNEVVSPSERLQQRCLHNWADVRATAALGFAGFSVFAEYRIFNFVKHDLPEIPRIQFGIRISGKV